MIRTVSTEGNKTKANKKILSERISEGTKETKGTPSIETAPLKRAMAPGKTTVPQKGKQIKWNEIKQLVNAEEWDQAWAAFKELDTTTMTMGEMIEMARMGIEIEQTADALLSELYAGSRATHTRLAH